MSRTWKVMLDAPAACSAGTYLPGSCKGSINTAPSIVGLRSSNITLLYKVSQGLQLRFKLSKPQVAGGRSHA
jgi:hypothetical protein